MLQLWQPYLQRSGLGIGNGHWQDEHAENDLKASQSFVGLGCTFGHTIIIPEDTHKFFIDKLREVGETVSRPTAL